MANTKQEKIEGIFFMFPDIRCNPSGIPEKHCKHEDAFHLRKQDRYYTDDKAIKLSFKVKSET